MCPASIFVAFSVQTCIVKLKSIEWKLLPILATRDLRQRCCFSQVRVSCIDVVNCTHHQQYYNSYGNVANRPLTFASEGIRMLVTLGDLRIIGNKIYTFSVSSDKH